jgi:hypothetical protein
MPPSNDVSYFGETTARAKFRRFGIHQRDRLSHLYVIGKTGVGKSSLLELLARQDIRAGRGFILIDPHGELAESVHDAMGRRDVIYLDATDPSCPFGYNPLRRVRDGKIPLAASGILETFRKLWPDAWGVRMEHVLRNSLYALLERERSTLPDILRLYADPVFRKGVTAKIRNEIVRAFWKTEFDKYPERYKLEVTAPIQNKLGALLADPALRRILVTPAVDLHSADVGLLGCDLDAELLADGARKRAADRVRLPVGRGHHLGDAGAGRATQQFEQASDLALGDFWRGRRGRFDRRCFGDCWRRGLLLRRIRRAEKRQAGARRDEAAGSVLGRDRDQAPLLDECLDGLGVTPFGAQALLRLRGGVGQKRLLRIT